jgi:hypothetical protein
MEALATTTIDTTQAEMRRLHAGFWQSTTSPVPPKVALTASLLNLAETLDRKLTENALRTYLAALSSLSPEELVLAFSRASMECRHFPAPALLLEYDSWRKAETTKNPPQAAIAESLDTLAQHLDRTITTTMVASYYASLEDLTREEIVLAFSRARDESKFLPAPATLREYSGRPIAGRPVAAEGRGPLQYSLF